MKTRLLLTALLCPCCLMTAGEPEPKLAPRPIPGLAAPAPAPAPANATANVPASRPVAGWETPAQTPAANANPDQARVIYIHRRATLPPALTSGLPAVQETKASSPQVQVRQPAVKIIPKAQAEAARLAGTKNGAP